MTKKDEIWYHGTTSAYAESFDKGVSISKSRPTRDFGIGFYLTQDKNKAISWASKKAFKANTATNIQVAPMILTCKIKISKIQNLYNFKDYGTEFNKELLDYLVFNRINRGETSNQNYNFDIVFGLIADGPKLDKTLSLYSTDMLKFVQAKQRIEFSDFQTQLCIKNQEIIDSEYFEVVKRELVTF